MAAEWVSELRRAGAAIVVTAGVVLGALAATSLALGLMATYLAPVSTSGGLSNEAQWFALAAFQLTMIGLALLAARLFGPYRDTLAMRRVQGSLRALVVPLGVTVAVVGVFSAISFALFPEAVRQDMAIFQRLLSGVPLWIPFLVLAVGAPLSEELVFRGFLLGQLRQTRLGFAGAAVVATLGWTLLHLSYTLVGLVDVFLAGLLFAWALWRTGSIWVPIAFHGVYNAAVLIIISNVSAHPV